MREVALALPPRIMRLGEHHFSLRTRSRPPLLEPPLQTPQLTFLESPRVLPPQILKHRLRLNRRMQPKDLLDLPPYRFERIRSGSPSMSLPNLARQLLHLPGTSGPSLRPFLLSRLPGPGSLRFVSASSVVSPVDPLPSKHLAKSTTWIGNISIEATGILIVVGREFLIVADHCGPRWLSTESPVLSM